MAKSKQQKREEALVRQLESFKRDQRHLIKSASKSSKYYDADHHRLVWRYCVNSAYSARVDIHGNYLGEEYYKKPWQFSKDADPKDLAENFTAYTLEELKQRKAQDGQTLFKKAYGTEPFVDPADEPYSVDNAVQIAEFLFAGSDMTQ